MVSESGNVSTRGITSIKSPTSGVVEGVYVKNGDIVGINQKLFKVVSTATEDEKVAAYAEYLSAQSDLDASEQAKMTLEVSLEEARKEVLDTGTDVHEKNDLLIKGDKNPATGKYFTKDEIRSIDSSLKSASYEYNLIEKQYVESDVAIEAARADLSEYTLLYESTKSRVIKSPTIGTISNLSIAVGDAVRVETLTHIPEPVLSIANFSSNVVIIYVNESDISKLQVGQNADVDPDALSIIYNGTITRIDDIGETSGSGGVVDYKVYLELVDADEKLKSGMTVDVSIITNEVSEVLSVPNPSVKPYQGGRAVRVLDSDGEIEFLPVEIGVKGKKYTQILGGVEENRQIIVSLSNGDGKRKSSFGF